MWGAVAVVVVSVEVHVVEVAALVAGDVAAVVVVEVAVEVVAVAANVLEYVAGLGFCSLRMCILLDLFYVVCCLE